MARLRIATILTGAVAALVFATPTDVRAQTLNTFGVLGASTVTNTGFSVITGNVGVADGSEIVGFINPSCVTSGPGLVDPSPPYFCHSADAIAIAAQTELDNKFTTLMGLPFTQDLTGQDLSGMTLTPGVYFFSSGAALTNLNGPLTLDAQGNPNGQFIFQIGDTLITDSGSTVALTGGAQGGNVNFVVGSSATLGTTTTFVGQILALANITLNNNANILCGAAWARVEAVNLDDNNITICALAAATFGAVLGPNATANQLAIAAAFDAFILGGGILPPAFQALLDFLTPAELAAAFDQLSGEAATGAAPAATQSMNSFLSLLGPFLDEDERGLDDDTIRALGYAGEDAQPSGATAAVASFDNTSVRVTGPRGWNIWAGVYGSHNWTAGDAAIGSHDRSTSAFGFAGGFDTDATAATRFGVAFSGGGTNFGLSQNLGTGRSDALQAAVYSRTNFDSAHFGAAYVATTLAFAWHGVSTDRFVIIPAAVPPVSEHFTSSYSAHNVAGEIEAGYRYNEWISPYAALRVQAFFTPAYSESPAPGSTSVFALNYHAQYDDHGPHRAWCQVQPEYSAP